MILYIISAPLLNRPFEGCVITKYTTGLRLALQ